MSGGAYIRIKGGNIEIHAPSTIDSKAASHPFSGPTEIGVNMMNMPSADDNALTFILKDKEGNIHKNTPYVITDESGAKIRGVSDDQGRTRKVHTINKAGLAVTIDDSSAPFIGD